MESNDIRIADYNRIKMDSRLNKLISLVRGTNISILPFITDEDGFFSSEKAYSFIRELLNDEDKFEQKEIDFLTAFFYCTFRSFSNEKIAEYVGIDSIYEQFRPCSTFQDVLDKARLVDMDEKINSKERLAELEYFNLEDVSRAEMMDTRSYSFFISMDLSHMMITDGKLRSIDPEGFDDFLRSDRYAQYMNELQESVDRQEEMQKEDFARDNGFDSYSECEEWLKENGYKDIYDYEERVDIEDYYNSMSTEELEERMREQQEDAEFQKYIDELNKLRKPQWDNYKESFVEKEEFLKRYKQYRQLFFEVDKRSFYSRIENIIFNYMYENKMSIFADDDATFSAFDLIEDTQSRLEASFARIRRNNGLYR